MELKRLEVKNFLGVKRADVSLADGLLAVLGTNNMGKSSLIQAMGYGLTAIRARGVKEGDVVHTGAKKATIVLGWDDDTEWTIERTDGGSFKGYMGGKKIPPKGWLFEAEDRLGSHYSAHMLSMFEHGLTLLSSTEWSAAFGTGWTWEEVESELGEMVKNAGLALTMGDDDVGSEPPDPDPMLISSLAMSQSRMRAREMGKLIAERSKLIEMEEPKAWSSRAKLHTAWSELDSEVKNMRSRLAKVERKTEAEYIEQFKSFIAEGGRHCQTCGYDFRQARPLIDDANRRLGIIRAAQSGPQCKSLKSQLSELEEKKATADAVMESITAYTNRNGRISELEATIESIEVGKNLLRRIADDYGEEGLGGRLNAGPFRSLVEQASKWLGSRGVAGGMGPSPSKKEMGWSVSGRSDGMLSVSEAWRQATFTRLVAASVLNARHAAVDGLEVLDDTLRPMVLNDLIEMAKNSTMLVGWTQGAVETNVVPDGVRVLIAENGMFKEA